MIMAIRFSIRGVGTFSLLGPKDPESGIVTLGIAVVKVGLFVLYVVVVSVMVVVDIVVGLAVGLTVGQVGHAVGTAVGHNGRLVVFVVSGHKGLVTFVVDLVVVVDSVVGLVVV